MRGRDFGEGVCPLAEGRDQVCSNGGGHTPCLGRHSPAAQGKGVAAAGICKDHSGDQGVPLLEHLARPGPLQLVLMPSWSGSRESAVPRQVRFRVRPLVWHGSLISIDLMTSYSKAAPHIQQLV